MFFQANSPIVNESKQNLQRRLCIYKASKHFVFLVIFEWKCLFCLIVLWVFRVVIQKKKIKIKTNWAVHNTHTHTHTHTHTQTQQINTIGKSKRDIILRYPLPFQQTQTYCKKCNYWHHTSFSQNCEFATKLNFQTWKWKLNVITWIKKTPKHVCTSKLSFISAKHT